MQTEIETKFLEIKPHSIRADLEKNKAVLVHLKKYVKNKE